MKKMFAGQFKTGLFLGIMFILAIAMSATSAQAATLTLTNAQINSAVWASTVSNGGLGTHLTGGNQFADQWTTAADGFVVTGDFTTVVAVGVAGDRFALTFENSNLNTWNFQLITNIGLGSQAVSTMTAIPTGGIVTLTTAPTTAAIVSVTLRVSATLPVIGTNGVPDRDANYHVTAAPEPDSLMLLGSALAGLALIGRRFAAKK